MNFYTKQHKYYCGIDLHAKSMYLYILNQEGGIVLQRNIRTHSEIFLKTIEKYREDIVVAVECIFTWYWIADLCGQEHIPFVLVWAILPGVCYRRYRAIIMESYMPDSTKSQQPKLLDQVRRVLRLHHYSIHTERSYVDWIVRFVRFHSMRSREDLFPAEAKIESIFSA
jgi:hypothetical protein